MLAVYCDNHLTVWDEIQTLRRGEGKDLLVALVTCVCQEPSNQIALSGELAVRAVQVFNTLVEHSHATAVHAYDQGCLERLTAVRASTRFATEPAIQRELEVECLRAYFYVLRANPGTRVHNMVVTQVLWDMLCKSLLDSSPTANVIVTLITLECIADCHSLHDDFAEMCTLEWELRGERLLQRLARTVSLEESEGGEVLQVRKLAAQALQVMICSNQQTLDLVWKSRPCVLSLLETLKTSSLLYCDRIRLLTGMIKSQRHACEAADGWDLETFTHLLERYEALNVLPVEERGAYFELLPVLITQCTRGFSFQAKTWKAIVENVLFFLQHGTPIEAAAAHAAFQVFLRFEANRSSLSDAFSILKQIWSGLYRSLEYNAVEVNESPASIVSFIIPGHAARGRRSVDIRAKLGSTAGLSAEKPRHPKLIELRSSCRDLRFAISTILQLGRILASSRCDELYCAQLSISLLMAQVYYVDGVAEDECLALSEVLSSVFVNADDMFAMSNELWVSGIHFTAFSCWLIRAVSSNQSSPQHFLALSLLSKLLEASTRKKSELSCEFNIRCALANAKVNVIDTVWWSKQTTPNEFVVEHNYLALWCNILRFACVDEAFSRQMMTTQLLHHLVCEDLTTPCSPESFSSPANVSMLLLFKTICCLHQDDPAFVDDNVALFDLVADRCLNTVALLPDAHVVKFDAIELLSSFLRRDHFLRRMWKCCILFHGEHSKNEQKARRMYLRGISDLIFDCQDNDVALGQALDVLFQLCTSELGVDPLLIARQKMNDSMVDIIQVAIRQTVGTSRQLELHLQRGNRAPITQLTDFLPSVSSSSLNIEGCRTALKLLQLSMTDTAFVNSLQNETEIFCELFAALGCPDWEVANSAASIIARALRWPTTSARGANDETDNNDVIDISRYKCTAEPNSAHRYRRLTFFALVNEQIVFEVEPDDTGLSSVLLVLVAWAQFYFKNLELLQKKLPIDIATRVHDLQDTELNAEEETPRQDASRNLCEQLLLSILEILLYLLSNFFSEVFDTTGDVPIPEEKVQHSELCVYLLGLCKRNMVADQHIAVVEDDLIRYRALSLLHVLCSFDQHQYSAEVFEQEPNVIRVLTIVETTKSVHEQQAAVRLLYDISSYPKVKDLFVSHQTLLLHVCSWLENPRLELLQPFAIGILKNLATKSIGQRRQNVFAFAPSFQEQLARTLFQGKQYGRKVSIAKYTAPKKTVAHKAKLDFSLHQHLKTIDKSFLPIKVKSHIHILDSNSSNQRVFQLQSQIRSLSDRVTHQILLDEVDSVVTITVTLTWKTQGGKTQCKVKQSMMHSLTSSEVSSLNSTKLRGTTMTLLAASEPVVVSFSDKLVEESSDDLGALGRLLRHEGIDATILSDATSIVSELCKNHVIFCDTRVKLWNHVLSAMASSARVHTPHHKAKVDLSCLHSMSSWFWSKSGVTFFKTTMIPLLSLIQGMRNYGFARNLMVQETPQKAKLARHDRTAPLQFESVESVQQQQNFLTALMEWVAAIEAPEFTENCLNIIFLENTDVLLFLCSEIFPARSARASFFFLVATAVRTNMVHCEVFARKHALQLLSSILDASNPSESEASRAEMLQFAARAIAKISRHATARERFVRHGGMHLFGRVAFEVFQGKWAQHFPQQAAENLVLAASFLCDFATQHAFVDPTDGRDMMWLNLMMTRTEDSAKASFSLSVVEALLYFLSRSSNSSATTTLSNPTDRLFNSFDRLAASVLSSLIEKHPRRVSFERHLLELIHRSIRDSNEKKYEAERLRSIFTAGLRRCIALTKWDFASDLNVVRRTYYAGICAGVRTRVVPPQCRTVFSNFDQDFLLSGAPRYQQPPTKSFADATSRTARDKDWFSSIPNENEEETGRVHPTDDNDDGQLSDKELKDLLAFVANHEQLVVTLTENRKKHLLHSVKVADRNSRLLVACHSTLSLVLDFYVDMVAIIQTEKSESSTKEMAHRRHHQYGDLRRIAVIQQWLMNLEELSGLVCCSLHELDSNYYGLLAQQLHSLVTELPTFLHKMERIQSKMNTLLLFLRNLNTVLKRIANKNELKGVAGNGFGVALEAKILCEKLREMESEVAEALAYVLTSKSAYERFARMLVAMNYMWKRVLGPASLSEFMEGGGTQITDALWKKLRRRITTTIAFLANPGPFFVTQGRKMLAGMAAMMKTLLAKEYAPSAAFYDVNDADKPYNGNIGPETHSPDTTSKLEAGRDVSYFPFCSMESLLDHFGYTSLRSKKTKQTFSIPSLKHQVLELLSQTFASSDNVVEKLSVLQLEANFQSLASDEAIALLQQLRELLDEADAGIQIRIIDKTPLELSLWRFLVRPIQRARLYRLHLLVDDFMSSTLSIQHEILKEYQQEEENHLNRKESLFAMSVLAAHKNSTSAAQDEQGNHETKAVHNFPPIIKKVRGSGRKQTSLLETLKSSRLKLKIGVSSEDLVSSSNRRMPTSTSGSLFDADIVATCDKVSCEDPLSEEMAVEKLRKTLHDQKKRQGSFLGFATPYRKYLMKHRTPQFLTRIHRRLQLVVLLVAFWRQEELTSDLKNEMLARAFDSQQERNEYFLSYHVRKAFAELVRIWMPESGDLGLLIWQSKKYFLVGTFAAVLVVYLLPHVYDSNDSERNRFMTRVIFGYVICMYLLTGASIFAIVASKYSSIF